MTETWHCEQCGTAQTGEPAYTKTYPGYDGQVTLWFCERCSG